MGRALIGLIPLFDRERNSYWMLPGYMQGVLEAGAVPVMLPLRAGEEALGELAARLDGLVITGGQDTSPELYGEQPLELCGEACPEREAMEKALLFQFLEQDKPVLGICRGIQILNVLLGGSLYQDIPSQLESDCRLAHRQPAPYQKPSHSVKLCADSPLWRLYGQNRIEVNSCHHQGIRELAPPLKAMAVALDGLTEAVHMPDRRFVWGVQWHPEFSYAPGDERCPAFEEESKKIFQAFAEACAS